MIKISQNLSEAIRSSEPVAGFTHNFYRYPARFSPQFARAVIHQFSQSNDCIIDPFMGGGTSIVEAVSMNRQAVGIDLNSLAHFITTVKTTPLSEDDKKTILEWMEKIHSDKSAKVPECTDSVINFPRHIQRVFNGYLTHIEQLPRNRQRRFARGVLLKTGQWAIDCRDRLPSIQEIKHRISTNVFEMFGGLDDLVSACAAEGLSKNRITQRRDLFCRSTVGIEDDSYLKNLPHKPRLVITSPPYPGVHVLYHRWQVNGRKETPAPYWLTALSDGHGEGFYTLGGRSKLGLEKYFTSIQEAFKSLRNILHPQSIIVQLIAFSEIASQLDSYLGAMRRAGYRELQLFSGQRQSRIWRNVPNRKWYSNLNGEHDSFKELLLVHQLI